MPWTDILNHDEPFERFRRTLQNNRLASTYLFVGPDGIGKRAFALRLAQALLCENVQTPLMPCQTCSACQQVIARTHPDLILISKPADKAFIPLEVFIGDAEHRRQRGLCHDIGLKPFRGGRKIAIIDDADFLNVEGANSLLKTLEEPPPKSLLILLGSSEQKQLSTIVSRSQIVRFQPLTKDHVVTVLRRMELETTTPIEELAAASGGSVARAIELSDEDVYQFRSTLRTALASLDPGRDNFGKDILGFVESAGKDSSMRRARLRMVGDFAIEFFDAVMHTAISDSQAEHVIVGDVADAINRLPEDPQLKAEAVAVGIERTVQMQHQVGYNASPINIILPWLKDLAACLRGGHITTT
jgi:DNA polymerase-3 subunit delta'